MNTQRARLLFIFFSLGTAAIVIAWLPFILPHGKNLNISAWEHSYKEHGLQVPKDGPREGFWGVRHAQCKSESCTLHSENNKILISYDETGSQTFGQTGPVILVVGSSVAWGSYAQDQDHTWWAILAKEIGAQVVVRAYGGFDSLQELHEAKRSIPVIKPDLVLWLTGGNDLLRRQGVGLTQRISDFKASVQNLRKSFPNQAIVVVRQPSMLHKARTPLEERILQDSLKGFQLNLPLLAWAEDAQSVAVDVDLRTIFDSDKKTVFSDIWHFGDPGHKKLATEISKAITPKLQALSVE